MGKAGQSPLKYDFMRRVGAVVLGGGRGTRLYPLTKVRSKPAVPLGGRYRLIDIPLSNCIRSGIDHIFVLTQFNSHSLNRHIGGTYQFDAFTDGYVQVLAAEQTNETGDWFQGTADAVRKHLLHIREFGIEHYLILSGDHLYHMDYRTIMATHLKKGADITVSALPVTRQAAPGFGIIRVRRSGRIREFVEKPFSQDVLGQLVTPENVFDDAGLEAKGKPYLASMGVYAFRAQVLEELLIEHPEWVDFGKELLPNALKTHNVFAHMFSGYWEDIGTVKSYFDASMDMTAARPVYEFDTPDRPTFTHARALPGVKILNADIRHSIICGGSRIAKASINHSIIGIRSIIGAGAEIDHGVVLGADYYEDDARRGHQIPIGIGANARIKQAIIDHNARIGRGVVIRGSKRLKDCDEDGFSIRDGIVVVYKNAVIPKGTVIE